MWREIMGKMKIKMEDIKKKVSGTSKYKNVKDNINKKRKLQIPLMNTSTKILNKILEDRIQWYRKRIVHYDKMVFIPERQEINSIFENQSI